MVSTARISFSLLTICPRTINLPTSSIFSSLCRPFPSNPPVICASQTPYIISVENDEAPLAFPAMRNAIQTVVSSSTDSASAGPFLASDNDRYINVFDPQTRKLVLNLVADKEVSSLSLYTGTDKQTASLEKQALAAVTEDGTIELFTKPFYQAQGSKETTSLKAKGRQMTRRADASIQITRSETSDALVSVVTASFEGPDVVVAYAEGGVIPVFERIRWQDQETDELAFTGTKKVPKSKSSSSVIASVSTNKAKNARESQVDESRAVVEQGNMAGDDDVEMQDSKQDAASEAGSEEEGSDDEQEPKKSDEKKDTPKKKETDSDVEMQNAPGSDAEGEEGEEEETGEPSFGELMRANTSEEVDVEAELDDEVGMGALVPGKPNAAVQQIPTGISLSSVLTQALKTNDSGMLESCFHTGDLSIIRTTIQRLDSSLAATLLQRLAERLSSRPGRYGHLLVWVQWTCVAHGGALAGKPELLKRMTTLFKVMDQRSSSLSSLLLLKGKLDMLDAQLSLRRSIHSNEEGMDSEDEENIIYVEGQEDEEDEDSDAETKNAATPRTKSIRDQAMDEDESMINGVQSGVDDSENDEDEGSEEEEDEDENILDVEAEESAGSSDAEESLEEDEDEDEDSAESEDSLADFVADTEDEGESDVEINAQPPPSKKAKMQGGANGKNKGGRK